MAHAFRNDPTRGRTCTDATAAAVRSFGARLPGIRAQLEGDARAAYDGDPAATSPDETVSATQG
jgi:serine O-acetyltransferase